ncbi:recombination-associated protein RdgC [Pseudomonas aeruginosa]
MLFNNYQVYRLTQELQLDQEALEAALARKPARPCESQELSTYGFTSPLPAKEDEADQPRALSLWSENAVLIAARSEKKNLPGSAVRDEVNSRVKKISAEQSRKVYKKERDAIKDQVVLEFLPRAFTSRSTTMAYIDLKMGLIVVDAASPKKAEDLLSTLREAIGSLPVRPVSAKVAVTATLTDWLKQKQSAPDFFVLDACELQDTCEGGATVKCKNQDLTSEEIALHLSSGKIVTKLSIAYADKLSFTLTDKLSITKVRFEDVLKDQAASDGGDDGLSQYSASFTMMLLTNRLFIEALLEALGGEEVPNGI